MTIRVTCPRIAAGLAAGVIIGLFVSGVAYAVTGNVFRYLTPMTASYAISALAFSPADANANFFTDTDFSELKTIDTSGDCFHTGINLPQGAKITRLVVWYSSASAGNVRLRIIRYPFNTGGSSGVAGLSSTDTSGARVAQAVQVFSALATVNNNAFSYAMNVCLKAGDIFNGARIRYTYRTAGD